MGGILNLTQHIATPEQIAQGVYDCKDRDLLCKLLTFEDLPTQSLLESRAAAIAFGIAVENEANTAMIGGAPFFMSELEYALVNAGIKPVYAFSKRVSEETVDEDGNVTKVNAFKHIGFVEVGNV